MANEFHSYKANIAGDSQEDNILTASTNGGSTTVIGMTVANTSGNTTTMSVIVNSGTTPYYIVKNANVPIGGSLVIIGGDQKVVLEDGDIVQVVSNQTVDAILSTMEIIVPA